MLNFRKLKQDFSPSIIKDGRALFEKKQVESAKIVTLSPQSVRIHCQVTGSFENTYSSEIEIDRRESMIVDSDCDCPYKYDCQHLAAVLFFLEENFNEILINFSRESDLDTVDTIDESEKETLRETIKEAETKEVQRRDKKYQKELLQEYINASKVLGRSPFFIPQEDLLRDKAELIVIFSNLSQQGVEGVSEIQLALRLPFRSKPLNILNVKEFLDSVKYQEALYIGNKKYYFTFESFDEQSLKTLKMIMDSARFQEPKEERMLRTIQIELETLGSILAEAYEKSCSAAINSSRESENSYQTIPWFYLGSFEEPLRLSTCPASVEIGLEYLEAPAPKILLEPSIRLDGSTMIKLEEARVFECAKPGLLHHNTYYRFNPQICRKHLRNLSVIRDMTIPEPLFGTFVENALPQLMQYVEVSNRTIIDRFVTLPFVGKLSAECEITYLNGELEAVLHFLYDDIKVPAVSTQLNIPDITSFITPQGILARNLTEEQQIIDDLFQDFVLDPALGAYVCKMDKKIVEFMTEIIPRNQQRVKFNCPENLLDQFIYDNTHFKLHLRETNRIDVYEVDLKVDGHLNGTTIDLLWDCLSTRRAYIELSRKGVKKKSGGEQAKSQKILILNLEKLSPVVQIFDEIGITHLNDHKENRPLWSLVSLDVAQFDGLPIEFSISEKLQEIQKQMLGMTAFQSSEVPSHIVATPRSYQLEGTGWLERLRTMHLNGILADDMGLGKTLQAIIALTQHKQEHAEALSIVVCPTSLVYNWKEEICKFNPKLRALPIDGAPVQRKKLLNDIHRYDVVITSYSLLQKDIDFYKTIPFSYAILDEAQHIKNRGTRNAKSVKMMQAAHRLILTGTPIENSLDELWSLFDFLMPGLLSSYDRFVEKYIRNPSQPTGKNLELLRKKVSPFILRRMKKDVLSELPPVSEIVYHCNLSPTQHQLYQSYAASAREELSKLVKKEGFEKVQIHVLATLTRLKQICCHPAIFAKEKPEAGDSSKYDMLMELLPTLMEGKHKTVIFSQYTRMLNIMREDLKLQGIRFEYLDGSSKNRMEIVKNFNENASIPIFLVSLKAGGTGLNLVGADTVIHYDLWWNPAVENQATDRVNRIGQKSSSVSAYKFVTKGTIEEKIMDLQNRKKDLVKRVVTSDEDAISKLTWEEVLELLQT